MPASTRRRFLSTASLAALGIGAPVAGLRAFTIEPLEGALEESYLAGACGAETRHQGFIAEVQALLAQYGVEADEAAVEKVVAATRCPYCRCPLTAEELAAKPGL